MQIMQSSKFNFKYKIKYCNVYMLNTKIALLKYEIFIWHPSDPIDISASGSGNPAKKPKRKVSVATFQKWQKQEEKEHKTISWLRCDKQQSHVTSLWCQACRKFENNIRG
jgi:hypothetical protein